jgi:hypothetical protein
MPAFGPLGSAKLKAVLSHLRTLQGKWAAVAVTGNPQRGKSIFFGKARDGKKYEGVTRNEDNFSMQLQSLDGTFHLLAKSEIERVGLSRQPLMPADYNSALDSYELDDLVSHLVAPAKSSNRTKPAKARWQDDEVD